MRYASTTLLALAALALPAAQAFELRAAHKRAADAPHLDKRYPPGRATTYTPSTTPAYAATPASAAPTASSSSSSSSAGAPATQTTPAPGQFQSGTTRALVAATTSTATTCAPPYAATSMITGTGTLPRPTSFVKKVGLKDKYLSLDGQPFIIVGPNIYWLCQDENYGPLGSYTDKGRIREALAIAVAMGANTIRALTCGISVGTYLGKNPYNLEPAFGQINQAAWDVRDYVLFAAREYGLRVIMTLTDNYAYYHGGKYDHLNFKKGALANGGAAFYTNRAVIGAYMYYIGQFMIRVNSYTGVAYVDDPTILAWETGNELGGYINAEMWPPALWTSQLNTYIRKYDKNHLLLELTLTRLLGSNGFWNYTNNAAAPGIGSRYSQIMTDHGYPRNTGILSHEMGQLNSAYYGKNFLIGEYDWTSTQSSTPLATYLSLIESYKPNVGDMIWNVMGHDPQCCRFISHNDGYSMYYPNGNSSRSQANILLVAQHWYRQTGRPVPSALVGVACPQPVF
ncbi:hypothetical protein JCM3770_007269 [Rhodotorula araucariae]